jgi:hypothetical protein
MNKEDIIRMAREAGCIEPAIPDWVIRTCAIVASSEREACAKICDEFLPLGNKCAYAIRARGQA